MAWLSAYSEWVCGAADCDKGTMCVFAQCKCYVIFCVFLLWLVCRIYCCTVVNLLHDPARICRWCSWSEMALQAAVANDCIAAFAHGLSCLIWPHNYHRPGSTSIYVWIQSWHWYAWLHLHFITFTELTHCELSVEKLYKNVNHSAFYPIRALQHIRPVITNEVAKTIACSFVTSRLDYANSVLYGISVKNIHCLQWMQNTLAQVVLGSSASKFSHSTEMLCHLH